MANYVGNLKDKDGNQLSVSEDYSTDEQIIGKWTNGATLYRRTFYNTNNDSQSLRINMNIANRIVDASGYMIMSDKATYWLGSGEASYAENTQGQMLYEWIPKDAAWAPGDFYVFGTGTLASKRIKEYGITLTYTKSDHSGGGTSNN